MCKTFHKYNNMEQNNFSITFASGAGSVTGSNFLVEYQNVKLLIDCGLEQGTKMAEEVNWEAFSYDPTLIDVLIITHAHLDHIGRIPKLIFDGFKGVIYSTSATKEIARIMLADTNGILGESKSHPGLKQMYNEEILNKTMSLWKTVEYHHPFSVGGMEITFRDAGHILGSIMAEFLVSGKKIVFTGDLGNSPSPILPDTEYLENVDYLIMESVYGDRNHDDRDKRKNIVKDAIMKNFEKKGVLLMPVFSLERTQELLFELNDMVESHSIPQIPIFIDSPLAIDVTEVFRQNIPLLNDDVKKHEAKGDKVFDFKGLKLTNHTRDSIAILKAPVPKVIIAASGMSEGGRIVHHEKNYLSDPNNALLLTGYQSPGSLGRFLEEGMKNVVIMDETVPVRASVSSVHGYSGHKDSDHLVDFVAHTSSTLKKVFVVLGEPKSSMFLANRLHNELGVDAVVPN